jgi:hypothetical protein
MMVIVSFRCFSIMNGIIFEYISIIFFERYVVLFRPTLPLSLHIFFYFSLTTQLTCASGVRLAAFCKAHGRKASMWSSLLGTLIFVPKSRAHPIALYSAAQLSRVMPVYLTSSMMSLSMDAKPTFIGSPSDKAFSSFSKISP